MRRQFLDNMVSIKDKVGLKYAQIAQKSLFLTTWASAQASTQSCHSKSSTGTLWLQLSVFCFFIAIFLFPETSFAEVTSIGTMAELSAKVKSEVQGNIASIVLNSAGIGTAAFALLTSRWTMLFFGAAYLVFVNLFFGFANGMFKA